MSGSSRQSVLSIAIAAIMLSSIASVFVVTVYLTPPEELFNKGMEEFEEGNFGTASRLFDRSYRGYLSSGHLESAQEALNMRLRSDRVLMEFSLDRTHAESSLAKMYPWIAEDVRNSWLDNSSIEKIVSDGRELFFYDVGINLAFRNLTLYHELKDGKGVDLFKDLMPPILEASRNATTTYFNPINYTAHGTLTLQRNELPRTGTLSVWVPAPINTASQREVTVGSVSPAALVKTMPSPDSDIGQAYLEIPLEDWHEDVVVEVSYSFTSYQKRFVVDPDNVGEYDRSSAEYQTYTASHDNILITPEIVAEARAVVGDETNPYLQAKLIYDYVVGNITYSYTPHVSLCARGIAESEYVRTHRYGDCGAQSMYYSALMRSLGVPARADGGFQMFGDGTGSHFWAEFLLPNYGWVPVDVTAADGMDWIWLSDATHEERAQYKQFFFGNLDPYRYVIQNDVDEPLDPLCGMPMPLAAAFQNPTASCDTSDQDVPVLAMMGWDFKITRA